jgi:hypothetical protein
MIRNESSSAHRLIPASAIASSGEGGDRNKEETEPGNIEVLNSSYWARGDFFHDGERLRYQKQETISLLNNLSITISPQRFWLMKDLPLKRPSTNPLSTVTL